MYKRRLILLLVISSVLFCSKHDDTAAGSSERPRIADTVVVAHDPVSTDSVVADTVNPDSIVTVEKTDPVINRSKSQHFTAPSIVVKRVEKAVIKIDSVCPPMIAVDTSCGLVIPAGFMPGKKAEKKETAKLWAIWMLEKAHCFKNMGILDSCFFYTMQGITTYENGSLFYLKGYLLNQNKEYSGAKICADVALNKRDFWDKSDEKACFKLRVIALRGLNAQYPSSVVQKQLQKAVTDYETNFGTYTE